MTFIYGGCNVNHGDDDDDDDDNDDFNDDDDDDDDVHAAVADGDVGSGNNGGVIGNDNGDDFIC